MGMRFPVLMALIGLVLFPCLASAHHPLAELYERGRTITLTGTVKAVDWVNPHAVLTVEAVNGQDVQTWRVELDPPSALMRRGWNRDRLAAGERIVVTAYPSIDGSAAVVARTIDLASGERLDATTDSSWNWRRAGATLPATR